MLNTLGLPKARGRNKLGYDRSNGGIHVCEVVRNREKSRRVIIWPGGVGRSGSNSCLAVWLFGFLVTRRRVTRLVWVGDGNARQAQLQTELQPNPN